MKLGLSLISCLVIAIPLSAAPLQQGSSSQDSQSSTPDKKTDSNKKRGPVDPNNPGGAGEKAACCPASHRVGSATKKAAKPRPKKAPADKPNDAGKPS
jgi:hypothetical protein